MIKTKEIFIYIFLILVGYLIAKMFSSIYEKFIVSSQSNSKNNKSSKSWIWIVSVILFMIVIGIVIGIVMYVKENDMVVTAELTSNKMTKMTKSNN